MFDFCRKKNVLILGAGTSGTSAYEFLKKNGHSVSVYDDELDGDHQIDLRNIDVIVQSPGIPFMQHNRHNISREADKLCIPVISCFDVFALYNKDAKIISITGTNGKSTVTALVTHIMQKSGIDCVMGGNIGISFCSLPLDKDLYIFEMSSYEIYISQYLRSNISCILNIKHDHLENHGTFENYVKAKHKLLNCSDIKIISCEDDETCKVFSNMENVIKISNKSKFSDVYEQDSVLFDHLDAVFDMSSLKNLIGKHNRQNILFSYAICKKFGITPLEIKRSLPSFVALPHRMNTIRKISKILFINDSKATNPDSSEQALDTFVGHRIYWLVGGRSKHASIESIMPYLSYIQKIYLFGESQEEFSGIFLGKKDFEKCFSIENALHSAFNDAKGSDHLSVILFSPMCSSLDQFKNFEERGQFFCKLVDNLVL